MAVYARPRIFNPKFKFQVSIDKIGSAAFQSCSELSAEFAEISYFEGGAVIGDPARDLVRREDREAEEASAQDAAPDLVGVPRAVPMGRAQQVVVVSAQAVSPPSLPG